MKTEFQGPFARLNKVHELRRRANYHHHACDEIMGGMLSALAFYVDDKHWDMAIAHVERTLGGKLKVH